MKYLGFIIIVLTIISCNKRIDQNNIIGTWECISSYEFQENKYAYPEDDEIFMVNFKLDSLIYWVKQNEDQEFTTYEWIDNSDSIRIPDLGSVYIQQLNTDSLIVEIDHQRIRYTFIRKGK